MPREKVAFLDCAALDDDGRRGSDGAGALAAWRGDTPGLRTAHEQGVPARESMLRAELAGARERGTGRRARSRSPRRFAISRNVSASFAGQGAYTYLLDRETNIPGRQSAFGLRHRAAAGGDPRAGDARDRSSTSPGRSIATARSTGISSDSPGCRACACCPSLLIDEAWHKVASPEAGVYLADLARRARHLGLLLFIITQRLSDLTPSTGCRCWSTTRWLMLKQRQTTRGAGVHPRSTRPDRGAGRDRRQPGNGQRTLRRSCSGSNGARGAGELRFPVGPTEYWTFTNEPLRDTPAARRDDRQARRRCVGGDLRAGQSQAYPRERAS